MLDPIPRPWICAPDVQDGAQPSAAAACPADCREKARLEQQVEDLKRALSTRDTIGAAVGILMVQRSCGPEEAFELLRRASMRENRKVVDLAKMLLERMRDA